jgi:hypothetical protein
VNNTIDITFTDRVATLVREIEQVEQARPTIEAEVAAAMAGLDVLAVRAQAAGSWWLPDSPQVTSSGVSDSIAAAMMLISPGETRKVVTARVRRSCDAWRGLRLSETDKGKRLSKLRGELQVARARVEVERRKVEAATGQMQPRAGDDPGVWLMQDAELLATVGRAHR